jgi:hypothetical protein
MIRLRYLVLTAVAAVTISSAAFAQDSEPIGRFVVDARVALPRFKDDASVATSIGVVQDNLPTLGLGIAGGAHVYPLRLGRMRFGVGGEILMSSGSNTLQPEEEGEPSGPTVKTRLSAFSPMVALNFGSRRGWSYVSAGVGWASYTVEQESAPVGDAESRPKVLNYGGGARWFAKEHLAFTFDLRWYKVSAQAATASRPPYPATTMMVFSAGVSLK